MSASTNLPKAIQLQYATMHFLLGVWLCNMNTRWILNWVPWPLGHKGSRDLGGPFVVSRPKAPLPDYLTANLAVDIPGAVGKPKRWTGTADPVTWTWPNGGFAGRMFGLLDGFSVQLRDNSWSREGEACQVASSHNAVIRPRRNTTVHRTKLLVMLVFKEYFDWLWVA